MTKKALYVCEYCDKIYKSKAEAKKCAAQHGSTVKVVRLLVSPLARA